MMKRISLLLPVLLFAAPFNALAQDHMIDGKAVPEGQMSAVEERCSELQAQQGTTGTQQPETTMTENAGDQARQSTSESGKNAAFDVSEITLQQCIDGGFIEGNTDQ